MSDVASPAGLRPAAIRALKRFRSDQMTDVAATLTYFAMMALFPGVLLGLTLFGIFGGTQTVTRATNYLLKHGADATTAQTVQTVLRSMVKASDGGVGLALVVSILLGANGASGAFAAAGRAVNGIRGIEDRRGFVKRKLSNVVVSFGVVVLGVLALASIVLGGQVSHDLFATIGLGDAGGDIWSVARFPVAVVAVLLVFALVENFAAAPSGRERRWFSPGAGAFVLLWVVVSLGFFVYVKNLSHYGAAYGAAGTVIVVLLWLWLSSCAFLLGAELNAQMDRRGPRVP